MNKIRYLHQHTIDIYIYIYITLSKIKEENPGMSLFIIDFTAKTTKIIDVLFKTSELFLKSHPVFENLYPFSVNIDAMLPIML